MIGNSPILQQAYGNRLPGMFAHFMSLSGVKGFEEYDPMRNQQAAPAAQPGMLPQPGMAPVEQPAAPIPANSQPLV